jgi:hypothetical protein
MIFETQTIFALMSLATQMIFALMSAPENQKTSAPTAKKRPSKITDAMVRNIKWLAEMPVKYHDIQRKYYPQLSVQSIALVAKYGFVPSTQKLLRLLAEAKQENRELEDRLSGRQVTQHQARDLNVEISGYEPAPRGAFNNGLGSGNKSAIPKVVRENQHYAKEKETVVDNQGRVKELEKWQSFCKEEFGLKKLLNEKIFAPIPNRCRQEIHDRWKDFGLESRQHEGVYDSIATICLAIIRDAGANAKKLNLHKLVDAAFYIHLPQLKAKIEEPYKQLRCTKCRMLRGYRILDGKAECLKCGTPHEINAKTLKLVTPTVDHEYETVIYNLFKSRGEPRDRFLSSTEAEPGPPLTPFKSRNAVRGPVDAGPTASETPIQVRNKNVVP